MPVQMLSPLTPPAALHQAAGQLGQAWAGSHAQEVASGTPIRFAGARQHSTPSQDVPGLLQTVGVAARIRSIAACQVCTLQEHGQYAHMFHCDQAHAAGTGQVGTVSLLFE